jgi:hypothetical protein
MPFTPDETMQWRAVELPFEAGVDLRQPSRLVQAPSLVKAENVRFDTLRRGLRRRRGHKRVLVRSDRRLDLDQATGSYLFGAGVTGDSVHTLNASPGPDAGRLFGMAKRDSEVLAWDGWRLFSYPSSADFGAGFQATRPAVMPHATTYPVGKKSGVNQTVADLAITDVLTVIAWVSGTSEVLVNVYDTATKAPYLLEHALSLGGTAACVRTVPCGEWVHIFVSYGTGSGSLEHWKIHRSRPSTVTSAGVVGDCNVWFDAKKLSDTRFLLGYRLTDSSVNMVEFDQTGATRFAFTPLDGVTQNAERVAVAKHPVTNQYALLWQDDGTEDVKLSVYNALGADAQDSSVVSLTDCTNIAIEAQYRVNLSEGLWALFVADTAGGGTYNVRSYQAHGTTSTQTAKRYWAKLASNPWRVGDAVFVNLVNITTGIELQTSYFMCDTDLKPVGRLEYGTAYVPTYLPGVYADYGEDARNTAKHHTVLRYRVRVDSPNNDQFDEVSLKAARYDFLPKLRSAQHGRCVYFAGAQLHSYDGREVVEAGMHMFPEHIVVTGTGTGLTGTYDYKVRWAYKNAQGEEVVSAELATSQVVLANQSAQLVIPTLGFTRRSGVYLLVYRREATGVLYYLVSSRDPADSGVTPSSSARMYLANDPTAATVTFTDKLSDANLISKEYDTVGNTGELEIFSPPASTVLAFGRDRLWLAGGELPPGDILPSKTFKSGFGPQFNQFLQTSVDRSAFPVTSIGFMGNSTVVFKEARVYAFEADGPNNLGQGSFDPPRVIVTDTGSVSFDATFLSTDGLWYQSSGGLTLLAINYLVDSPGEPVQPEAVDADFVGVVMIEHDQELRFYRSDGPALVWNTERHAWTTWTGLECVGAVQGPSGLMVLGRADGTLLVETEGLWTDGGLGYTGTIKTATLSGGIQEGWQRVRRFALLGDIRGDHTLTVSAFFDEKDFPEDQFTWDPADDLNSDTWGAGSWGAGIWGDTTADTRLSTVVDPKNRNYAVRRRLSRQKCSRIQFEITDGGCRTEGPAFSALALELGARGGLSRLPWRGGSSSAATTGGTEVPHTSTTPS